MFALSLSLPTRAAVTFTTLILVAVAGRALCRRAGPRGKVATVAILACAFLAAAAFSHARPLVATLGTMFPIGLIVGLAVALATLFSPGARRAFDALDDTDVRMLLAFRAILGGLVLALASLGHFPVPFGIEAGLGDLLVTWVAFAVPVRLDAAGPRWARLLVHGVGLADMLAVLTMAITMVRRWSEAHENAATSVTLPWVVVPLMAALNAHGVRRAARATGSEPVVDGSEPARGVRSSLS
jgi:hypothetical protein